MGGLGAFAKRSSLDKTSNIRRNRQLGQKAITARADPIIIVVVVVVPVATRQRRFGVVSHEVRRRRQRLHHLRPDLRAHIRRPGGQRRAAAAQSTQHTVRRHLVSSCAGRPARGARRRRHALQEIGGQHRLDFGQTLGDVALGRIEVGRRPEGAQRRVERVQVLQVGDRLAGEREECALGGARRL